MLYFQPLVKPYAITVRYYYSISRRLTPTVNPDTEPENIQASYMTLKKGIQCISHRTNRHPMGMT